MSITLQKFLTGIVAAVVVWVLLMSLLPLVVGVLFYRIDRVTVASVQDRTVRIQFHRWARIPLAGRCGRELQCDYVTMWPETACPIEPGEAVLTFQYAIPSDMTGECRLRGYVQYRPFGWVGPELVHLWESEPFVLPEGADE